MLGMYINRSNGQWAEHQSWGPPSLIDIPAQEAFASGADFAVHRADFVRKLREGKVAIQIFAAEDNLTMPNGEVLDIWSTDPWTLVQQARPGSMPLTSQRLEGVPIGVRALSHLAHTLNSLAGASASQRTVLLIHLNDAQQFAALKQLVDRNFCGFARENVVIMSQALRQGYHYEPSQRLFMADASSPRMSLGPGYALMQCGWAGEGLVCDNTGNANPLATSVWELLGAKGVE